MRCCQASWLWDTYPGSTAERTAFASAAQVIPAILVVRTAVLLDVCGVGSYWPTRLWTRIGSWCVQHWRRAVQKKRARAQSSAMRCRLLMCIVSSRGELLCVVAYLHTGSKAGAKCLEEGRKGGCLSASELVNLQLRRCGTNAAPWCYQEKRCEGLAAETFKQACDWIRSVTSQAAWSRHTTSDVTSQRLSGHVTQKVSSRHRAGRPRYRQSGHGTQWAWSRHTHCWSRHATTTWSRYRQSGHITGHEHGRTPHTEQTSMVTSHAFL
eukprot:1920294-Rhodomonas_salina.1